MNQASESTPQDRLGIYWILTGALLIRVAYLLLYSSLPEWSQLTVDNWYHLNWAGSIADGNILGDTTYFRAPLYIYALALLKAVFGDSLWMPRLLGLGIGLGSVYLTFLIGQRLFGRTAGLIAAGLHALSPITLYFESEILLDPLFGLLLEIAVYRLLIWLESDRSVDLFWTALWCGLASITRPTALIVGLLILVWAWWRQPRGKALVRGGIVLAGLAICVLPITIRNVAVAGDPVLIASQGGINLYIGNNEAADGLTATLPEPWGSNWQLSQVSYAAERARGRELRPGEISDYWYGRAIDWMTEHPLDAAALYARKVYHQFLNIEISNNRSLGSFYRSMPLLKYNPLCFGVILTLAAVGLFASSRSRNGRAVLMWIIAAVMVITSLFFFTSRFRLPLMPFWFVLAGAGAWTLLQKLKSGTIPELLRTAIPAVIAALVAFLPLVSLPTTVATSHLTARGLHAYNQGDTETALELFQEALRRDPARPEANLNVGACLVRLGENDLAQDFFEAERQDHPERHKVYQNLAALHLLESHPVLARESARRAVELAPYDVASQALLLRAIARDTTLLPNGLLSAADYAREATHDSPWLLNEIGVIMSGVGMRNEAERVLRAAIMAPAPPIETDDAAFSATFNHSRDDLRKEHAKAFYQLGYLTGMRGEFQQAIGYSRQAIARDSGLSAAYVNLVSGYLALRQIDSARTVLQAAVKRFPDDASIELLTRRLPGR